MKRQLLSTSLIIATSLLFGQGSVVVQVLTPVSIADSYDNAFASAANSWGVADLTIPANAVQGPLMIGLDGTEADSLGCEPLVNDLTGQIAVIYRGTCGFSTKALNAQNAGAIGVLLISNADNLAITMQGGTVGLDVTIPVAMISMSSGAIIRPVLDAEEVTAFIGNNFGAFPNNMNIDVEDVLVPAATSVPPLIAANATEFEVSMGSFMHNFGSEDQTAVRLRAIVSQNGTEIYNEVSDLQTVLTGDSVFVELPVFSAASYAGEYTITYSTELEGGDAFPQDNSYSVPLVFNDVFSYVPTDNTTAQPVANNYFRPATSQGAFRTCMQFSNANASRLAVTGMYFSSTTPADLAAPPDSALTDRLVTTFAFLWTDAIASPFDTPTDAGLSLLAPGSYSFTGDLQSENVFIPFEETLFLEDNLRYLFCVETNDEIMFHGWNTDVDYGQNANFGFIDPTSVIRNGTSWFNGFAGTTGGPAIAIQTIDATSIGINENANRVEITPYPNPTTDYLRIPMKGFAGKATLQIFDLNGSKVAERTLAVGGNSIATVDMTGIAAGTYMFHMEFENGQRSDFRAVVVK